jgi:hypothetical protein
MDAVTAQTGTASQQDSGQDSMSRLVAPVFAGFSLPAIIAFVSTTSPKVPWHDIVLSLLIAATGCFLASIQLSIGPLYDNHKSEPAWKSWRAGLTIWGIILVTFALAVLVFAARRDSWVVPALAVLVAGGIIPGLLILVEKWRDRSDAVASSPEPGG